MACAAPYVGLFLMAALPAAGAPILDGAYHGELGVLQFATDDAGRVVAHYEGGGKCPYEPERRLVEGTFQGNVLVGSVTLCENGPACHGRTYALMAFYDPRTGSLTGDIKVEPGCEAVGLKGQRLLLEKGLPEGTDGGETARIGSARHEVNSRKNAEEARKAFREGQRAVEVNDYPRAKRFFEISLSFDEGQNYATYEGLGVAELHLGHVQRALEVLKRSLDFKKDRGTYYNLACAYARLGNRPQTLASLNNAIQLGFAEAESMKADPDLAKLLAGDADFLELVERAKGQAKSSKGAHRTDRER